MSQIFTPEDSAAILAAMADAGLSNQGRATVKALTPAARGGLEAAGFVVKEARDLFGLPCLFVYTARAWEAANAEAAAKAPASRLDCRQYVPAFDVEGAILARDEARHVQYL